MKTIVKCQYINNDGMGVFTLNNKQFACLDFLVGEKAEVDIHGNKAKILNIIEKSDKRIKSKCYAFGKCGGCQYLNIEYTEELAIKQRFIKQLFSNNKVDKIIASDNETRYRNKIIATFSMSKNKIIHGQYALNTHDVIVSNDCLVQPEIVNKLLNDICRIMDKLQVKPYNEDRKQGIIRHVIIRINQNKDILLCFVLGTDNFKKRNEFYGQIKKACSNVKSIVSSINTRKTSVVIGDKEYINYGDGYIIDELLGNKYKISANTFYQINHDQTEKLYSTAIELANLKQTDRVLDAYCGIGTISLSVTRYVKEVVGVEINKYSIRNAIDNAKLNGITNCRFIALDCTEYMKQAKQNKEHFDVVFLDPAREGCTESFISTLCDMKPRNIVYISCNPITQKRDTTIMSKKGYKIKTIQPLDMFPKTKHVETVVLMSKVQK